MSELPKYLFKYLGPERIDVIEKLQIRFTQPTRLNDPFEMLPSVVGDYAGLIDKAEDLVHSRMYIHYALQGGTLSFIEFKRKQVAHNRQAMKDLRKPAFFKERAIARHGKDWDNDIGILSLSAATEKNLLLWAHYTNSHKGMILEFNPQHRFFSDPSKVPGVDFGVITKVIYSKSRPTIKFSTPTTDFSIYMTKSDDWAYEEEWRIYELLSRSAKHFVVGDESIHLFDIPPDSIRRVIVGCRMDIASRQRVVCAVEKNPNLHHVQIHEAKLDLDTFKLKYGPLQFH